MQPSWFNGARYLPVRYERRAGIYEAFTLLQASIITLYQIQRFCQALSEGSSRRASGTPRLADRSVSTRNDAAPRPRSASRSAPVLHP